MAAPICSHTLKVVCCCRSLPNPVLNIYKFSFCKLRTISRYYASTSIRNVRVRFAPSPTGHLHLGGLRTALYNFLYARSTKDGRFILRIEDTDQTRAVPGAVDKLQEALNWAGIIPDEGPGIGGQFGPYIQVLVVCSARRLELSRKEAARRGEPSKYDGRCRSLSKAQVDEYQSQGIPFVVRLKLEPTLDSWDDMVKSEMSHNVLDSEGDPVLMKSDGYPTYHFANVVDDHLMEVSHVLRGSVGSIFCPPLQDGTKLSKRQGDIHVEHFIASGYFPQAVLNYITSIGGGFSKKTLDLSLEQMCKSFDVSRIKSNPAQLNPLLLSESNRHILRQKAESQDQATLTELARQVRELVVNKFNERLGTGTLREQVISDENILKILRWSLQDERTSVLSDFVKPELEYLWVTPSQSNLSELVKMDNKAESLLSMFLEWVTAEENFTVDHLGAELRTFAKKHGARTSKLFMFLRMALTGLKEGPPVAEMMSVIGKDSVMLRLKTSLECVRHV
ncbi:unnamed protein product [Candidula unifasciata]|uniref:Glutamate--tRNA ligase n=1 Tax=Candidula unifasciata TaxID=100452 RepID=A0A8S3YYI8_9EUPU|nr:unnamed protein product [Candidula unifasciata]